MVKCENTQYGFVFGEATVTREVSGGDSAVCIKLETKKHKGKKAMKVYVDRDGSLLVYIDGKKAKFD